MHDSHHRLILILGAQDYYEEQDLHFTYHAFQEMYVECQKGIFYKKATEKLTTYVNETCHICLVIHRCYSK